MKIRITLGMLVRQEKTVTVEVPDDFNTASERAVKELMEEVYEADEGDGFTEDKDWGCEEATHHFLGESTNEPEYRLNQDGSVECITRQE